MRPDRPRLCMLVEDQVLVGLALEEALIDAGHAVQGPFATCASALAQLAGEPPDFAILDLTLMDGTCVPLARELNRREIPFVVFSVRQRRDEDEPELSDCPWVVKPALYSEVIGAAEKLLADGRRTVSA